MSLCFCSVGNSRLSSLCVRPRKSERCSCQEGWLRATAAGACPRHSGQRPGTERKQRPRHSESPPVSGATVETMSQPRAQSGATALIPVTAAGHPGLASKSPATYRDRGPQTRAPAADSPALQGCRPHARCRQGRVPRTALQGGETVFSQPHLVHLLCAHPWGLSSHISSSDKDVGHVGWGHPTDPT